MAGSWDTATIRAVLRCSAHFRDLPSETLDRMANSSRIRTLNDGELLHGRPSDSAFAVIVSGAMQLSLASISGHALAIAVLGQGSFVGLEALFGSRSADTKEYRSVGVCTLAAISADRLKRLLHEDPAFRTHSVKLLMSRLAAAVSALADVLHVPLAQRLARRLLGQALAAGNAAGKPVDVSVSQKLIAEMLGASRSTVSEELQRLERAGIIQRCYRRLRIVDVERLHQIAGDNVRAL